MIPNFLNIVQQDIRSISNYLVQQAPATKEQNEKVGKAALRILAVGGMVLACVFLAKAFTAVTVGGALFKLATAIALYVLSHDVFMMLFNSEKEVLDQAWALGKGLVDDAKDFWNGTKTLDDGFRHPHSEGTFLRPFWDRVLWNQAFSEQ